MVSASFPQGTAGTAGVQKASMVTSAPNLHGLQAENSTERKQKESVSSVNCLHLLPRNL